MAIAVLPEFVGRGIGSALLHHLLHAAAPHYRGVALSVRAENPALRLYQRVGFTTIGEIENRVGGRSYDMRLWFQK
ncbi:MAG: GNAT family N-acetyltransferase [Caldilineaceae bacterium]